MAEIADYDGREPSVVLSPASPTVSDGSYFVRPARAQRDWKPIYDQDTRQVIGFYTSSGNVKHIYDIEGRFVTIAEPGLEPSYVIDDLIFLLVGIGEIKYIFNGGRELLAVAGRRAAGAAAYGMAAGIVSESVIAGLRVGLRNLATRQIFKFTATTAARMATAGRFVPIHILQLAVKYGERHPDPQGAAGAALFVTKVWRLSKNGQMKEYTLSVVLRLRDWTILHFHME